MTTAPQESEKLHEMPFLEHFRELRRRLIYIVVVLFIGLLACFTVAGKIYDWLAIPIFDALPETNKNLVFLDPLEPFFVYLKLSLLAALFVSSPFIFYQIYRFVAPALYRKERRWILPATAFSSLIFVAGAAFCYYVVLPLGLGTLIKFGLDNTQDLVPQISMAFYYSLVIKLMLAFGLIFETPVFAVILARLGLITRKSLTKHWRGAVVGIFILAAVLTPPDAITQILLALPMILLYGVSILLVGLVQKRELVEEVEEVEGT
ncbi:MAG: twin-arginine translocase subunit TatC [Bradymonadales bacterium]|jgi:sec-independent protein translocase protein TatC